MLLNRIRAIVAEMLEQEVSPGVTRNRAIAEALLARAMDGDVHAIRLAIELAEEFDPVRASCWEGTDP